MDANDTLGLNSCHRWKKIPPLKLVFHDCISFALIFVQDFALHRGLCPKQNLQNGAWGSPNRRTRLGQLTLLFLTFKMIKLEPIPYWVHSPVRRVGVPQH